MDSFFINSLIKRSNYMQNVIFVKETMLVVNNTFPKNFTRCII